MIETFLLSCRVLGRNVEKIVLSELQKYCQALGLTRISARFLATSKNQPFSEFLLHNRWAADPHTGTYNFLINDTNLTITNKPQHASLDKTIASTRDEDMDRDNLLDLKQKRSSAITVSSPGTELESALYSIWKSLLGHDGFGIVDDFFQVGGNSLKTVQLVSRISRHFLVDIRLIDIYSHPTITQLAS